MNKRLYIKAIAFLTCILTSTSFMGITTYANTPETGGVAVETHTYTLDKSGSRTENISFSNLQPGQLVDYFITVKNTALPAYVRVKVSYSAEFDVNNEVLKGIGSNWILKDGYYYYKEPLDKDESVDLCTQLKLPNIDLSTGVDLKVTVDADAIQEANFEPDFDSNKPWGKHKIEKAKKPGKIYKDARSFALIPDNYLTGLVSKQSVLTSKGNPMPGDTLTDSVSISPAYDGTIYFRATSTGSIEESDLITLDVACNGTNIYSGPLLSGSLNTGVVLGKVTAGQVMNLNFTLNLDEELTNVSSWSDIPVTFYVAESVDITITPVPSPTPTPSVTPPPTILTRLEDVADRMHIMTGDNGSFIKWIVLAVGVIAIGFGSYALIRIKKTKDTKEVKNEKE